MTFGRGGKQQIAVVVYPGLSPLELVGTVSVLSGLGISTGFQTVTVGHSRDPLDTNTPVKVIPESTFAEVSRPSALLVPGGGWSTIRAMGDDALLGYVRDEDALTPLLTQHQAEWQEALGPRPDLLQAVQRALTPAAQAGSRA